MARGIGIRAEDLQHFTTEEKVAAARRSGIKLVKPHLYTPEEIAAATTAPPVVRTWDCRNCGAGVDERIDTCLLCGYEREKCTSCNGTGAIDSGPHPAGCDESCGCYNGYDYPPAETAIATDPVHCGDCGVDAPVSEDGEAVYSYTYAKHEVPLCGPCSARRG